MDNQGKSKPAKMCFGHIGGKLGILLMETFVERGWIVKSEKIDKHFLITEEGEKELTKLGVDVSQIQSEEL